MSEQEYTPEWYASHQQRARSSAAAVVPAVVELLGPRSVVDVGCGVGEWLKAFADGGVAEVLGVDGAYVKRANLRIAPQQFCEADLTQPPVLGRPFDLAVCLEVAEHLDEAPGRQLVAWLTTLAPVVLFSAAIPKQSGQDHRNEQWPDYWQAVFARHGFVAVDCLRERFWDDPRVAWYYAQNMILYVRRDRLADWPALAARALPEGVKVRRLVHPQRYLVTADIWCFSLGQFVRVLPGFLARSLRIRWERLSGRAAAPGQGGG